MNQQYENLVLSGGGVKVIASIGALQVIQEHGILNNITGIRGCNHSMCPRNWFYNFRN